MKRQFARAFALLVAVLLLSATVLETSAHARAGGSRSIGSRGSRSYSGPASSYRQSTPYQQPAASPMPGPMQQPGGGFMRSMAGGIAGGLLGGMLFRGMAGAGGMGYGGGGMGLFDIVLLAGICYLIYRMVKKRRAESPLRSVSTGYGSGGYDSYQYQGNSIPASYRVEEQPRGDLYTGISHLRQMDPAFDEARFKDQVMDHFFRIQGGWMNRDIQALTGLLTPEMQGIFREDIERLLREGRVNRLENVAVRSVELTEVWQEAGQDYVSALIYANLLDYTTDERGTVVAGSRTDPVKFEEYWTFTRPVGNNPWRLAAINQKD